MRQNEAKCGRELLPRMAFRSLRDTDCRSSVGQSHRVGGSSPPGSLEKKQGAYKSFTCNRASDGLRTACPQRNRKCGHGLLKLRRLSCLRSRTTHHLRDCIVFNRHLNTGGMPMICPNGTTYDNCTDCPYFREDETDYDIVVRCGFDDEVE